MNPLDKAVGAIGDELLLMANLRKPITSIFLRATIEEAIHDTTLLMKSGKEQAVARASMFEAEKAEAWEAANNWQRLFRALRTEVEKITKNQKTPGRELVVMHGGYEHTDSQPCDLCKAC